MTDYEVAVIGGGPAGLQAALFLARGLTRAIVFDSGSARHLATDASHGFLGADGVAPAELRRRGRQQLERYDTIEFRDGVVETIEPRPAGGFRIVASGAAATARFVVLATGVRDVPLDLPGYGDFWGKTLLHCPYCHGWEFRDGKLGVLVFHDEMIGMARKVTWWSRDVILFVSPDLAMSRKQSEQLEAINATIERRRVRRLIGDAAAGRLEAVELEDGTIIELDALYYGPQQRQCGLVEGLHSSLGLRLDRDGFVEVDEGQQTSVPGLYAAGDLTTAYQQIVEAARQGHHAAKAIEDELKADANPNPIESYAEGNKEVPS